jgi:hypothetical protein
LWGESPRFWTLGRHQAILAQFERCESSIDPENRHAAHVGSWEDGMLLPHHRVLLCPTKQSFSAVHVFQFDPDQLCCDLAETLRSWERVDINSSSDIIIEFVFRHHNHNMRCDGFCWYSGSTGL